MKNSTEFFTPNPIETEFHIGILYATLSFIPLPVSTTLIYVLIRDKELRRNPSYLIIVRLLICDALQSIAHVFTGFFIMFPKISNIQFLLRIAGSDVTVIWLMSYPLVCELAIFRCLVVTGKVNAQKLPLPLKIIEGIFWVLLVIDFIFCWTNQAVDFYSIYWDNDKERLFGQIANILEVYFGLPALIIAYIIYVSTLVHLVVKKKQFGTGNDARQEFSLFFQTTFESIYCFFLVVLWHTQDILWPDLDLWGGFGTDLAWIFYFYWKPALLLACNRTVRSKWLFHVFCLRRKKLFVPGNNSNPTRVREALITTRMSWEGDDERRICVRSEVVYGSDSQDHIDETETWSRSELPKDKFNIVYLIVLLNGIGVLLPWNMFITIAPSYYQDYWFSPNGTRDHYGKSFMSALGITSAVPGFILACISASGIIKGPLLWRIIGSLLTNMSLIGATLILAIVVNSTPDAEHWFYIVSLIIVMTLNASNGFYQNSIFGLTADFPAKFTNALVFGNNICGIFTTLVAVGTTLAFPNDTKAVAILYFSISVVVVAACLVSLLMVTRMDFYKFYLALGKERRRTEAIQVASFKDVLLNEYCATVKVCWIQFFNVFFTFFVTLSVYPTLLVGMPIPDTYKGTTFEKVYYDVVVFLTFNVRASVGSFVAEFVKFFLFIPVLMRLLFIPFFMFCNYDPADRAMPVWFQNSWWWISGNLVLALTSGYFGSLGMMYAPGAAPPHLQKVAGHIAALCLTGGLMGGLGFNYAVTGMVEHFG